MPKRKYNDDASVSFARLDVFARGMIWGMHVAKASREDICNEVVKKEMRPPSIQAVDQVIAHMKAFPDWRREDSKAGGHPGKLTAGQKKEVVVLSFLERGQAKDNLPCGVCRALIREALPNGMRGDFVLGR